MKQQKTSTSKRSDASSKRSHGFKKTKPTNNATNNRFDVSSSTGTQQRKLQTRAATVKLGGEDVSPSASFLHEVIPKDVSNQERARGLEHYCNQADTDVPKQLAKLEKGAIYLDVGTGHGGVFKDICRLFPKERSFQMVGLDVNPPPAAVRKRFQKDGVSFIDGARKRGLIGMYRGGQLDTLRGKVGLITDVMAANSYVPNLAHSLAIELDLLAVGGKLVTNIPIYFESERACPHSILRFNPKGPIKIDRDNPRRQAARVRRLADKCRRDLIGWLKRGRGYRVTVRRGYQGYNEMSLGLVIEKTATKVQLAPLDVEVHTATAGPLHRDLFG